MQSNYPDRSSKGLIATSLDVLAPIVDRLERLGLGSVGRRATSGTIRLYQQHVSPHKGFSCAHRRLYGELSCSEYFRQMVLTEGFSAAVPLFQQRLLDCHQANLTIRSQMQSASYSADPTEDSQERSQQYKKNRVSNSCDYRRWNHCDCSGCDCSSCDLPDVNSCDHRHSAIGDCDAGGCDIGACDAGACDVGACDVGSCDCSW